MKGRSYQQGWSNEVETAIPRRSKVPKATDFSFYMPTAALSLPTLELREQPKVLCYAVTDMMTFMEDPHLARIPEAGTRQPRKGGNFHRKSQR